MNISSLYDGVIEIAQTTALEVLSKKIPVESLSSLNEPIDFCSKYDKDVSKNS